jgi:hypothetical protein
VTLRVGEHRLGAPPAASQLVEARVRRDPVRPRAERGATVEAGQAPDDGDQGLLGRVQRVGVVPGDATAEGVYPVVVPSQQRVERASVARLGVTDELVVPDRASRLDTGSVTRRRAR